MKQEWLRFFRVLVGAEWVYWVDSPPLSKRLFRGSQRSGMEATLLWQMAKKKWPQIFSVPVFTSLTIPPMRGRVFLHPLRIWTALWFALANGTKIANMMQAEPCKSLSIRTWPVAALGTPWSSPCEEAQANLQGEERWVCLLCSADSQPIARHMREATGTNQSSIPHQVATDTWTSLTKTSRVWATPERLPRRILVYKFRYLKFRTVLQQRSVKIPL